MRFSSIVATATVAIASVSAHRYPYHAAISDYYTLGCPTNTTKPYASKAEQLAAITEYGQLLYIQKDIPTAEYTYVATDFINHAPEVPGNGVALAIKTLTPMLATSTIEILNTFVGSNATGSDFSVTFFKGNSQVQGLGVISDQWRMIGTCLVEHWDVAMGVFNSSNPNAYF